MPNYKNRLFVNFRLEFHPGTNQDLLRICAEKFIEVIQREWDNGGQDWHAETGEELENPIPSLHDATFELVMEATEVEKI